MFIQSCYLLKCSKKIIHELERLGYSQSSYCNVPPLISQTVATTACTNHYTTLTRDILENPNPHVNWVNGRINCNKNENLFLALASLQDDTDKNQWFCKALNDKTLYFIFCIDDKFKYEFLGEDYSDRFHKATVTELIKHFTNE